MPDASLTAIAPTAAPPSTVPSASVATRAPITDKGAIETVLSRYRYDFSVLDADAAKAVWPTVDAKMLGRAFGQLEQQTLEFHACAIAVTAARAEATCGGSARYGPKLGNKSPRIDAREWKFSLRKINETWLIEAVATH